MPKLFIYSADGGAFSFPLTKEKISVGRTSDNDIFVSDPYCSVFHAFIYPLELGYVIQDNNSKNGTFVNGKKIESETRLKKGDEILVGSTRIIFDKKITTNVEVVETTYPSSHIDTSVKLKDILKKPVIDAAPKDDSATFDLDRFKEEHKTYTILSEVSQALISHKPLDELLEHIMDLICQNLPMDRGVLMLKEGNPLQLIPKVIRINNKNLKDQKIQVSKSIINTVLNKYSSILTYDAKSDPRFKTKDSIVESDIHSVMCVPLWDNKAIIGVIYSDRIYLLDRFSNEELKLLTLLSNLAAVKIENAKLLEKAIEKEKLDKELELAAQIQKSFLPKEDIKCENFEIVGSNVPCYQVGGDYYDFITIDADRLGIIIADVSEKGVSASLLMASLRAALHSEIHTQYKLKETVKKLNDFIHRSSDINRFISFFYCELNNKSGKLRYINAGHNPPFILNHKGEISRLESCGFCLGMFPSVSYKEKTMTLKPNDIALLFTDGITECLNKEKKEFSEEKLINLFRLHSNLAAEKLMAKIFTEIDSFTSGADQMDDMTLVLIKRIS